MSRTFRAAGSDVFVGAIEAGLGLLEAIRGPLPLVSDARVWSLHGSPFRDRLPVEWIEVPEGEAAKRWDVLESVLQALARLAPPRDRQILALGGGSVGDLAGLAASLFKRGCPLIMFPTTLLAQVDSAVGGKTAIDFAGAKNLVGTFHPPTLVIADQATLATLSDRDRRAGYAEIVKYGLIDDPALFAWCEANGGGVLAGHAGLVEEAVIRSLKAKDRLIDDDMADLGGQRALLNLGHSFAHAIEALTGFDRLRHGEAVAIGLVLAHRFSARLGLCPADDAARIERHLAEADLPVRLADAGLAGTALLAPMERDKKNDARGLNLVLSHGIGRAFLARAVPREALAAFLAKS